MTIFLADRMTPEALQNQTVNGTFCIHQMISRGWADSVSALLKILFLKLGKRDCAALLNQQVGGGKLGCVDLSLKSKIGGILHEIKHFGGVEQQPPPSNWRKQRRYHGGSGAGSSGGADNAGRFREYKKAWEERDYGP